MDEGKILVVNLRTFTSQTHDARGNTLGRMQTQQTTIEQLFPDLPPHERDEARHT